MGLPVTTTVQDVEEMVQYLRTKPLGATFDEAKAVVENKLIDSRKINAYTTWGFIIVDGERLKLTERGRELQRVSPTAKTVIYQNVLREQPAYFLILEHAFYKKLDQVTVDDVVAHWYEHCYEELGTDNEKSIRSQVTSFFNVAAAAGLGEYIIGRVGQSTRFVFNRDVLGQFIAEAALTDADDPLVQTMTAPETDEVSYSVKEELLPELIEEVDQVPASSSGRQLTQVNPESDVIRVFISHGKNMDIVEQIKTMLEVAGLEFEIAEEEETTAIPVPEKVLSAMRKCNAGIICVTADEQSADNGNYHVNENVLIEIGTAFVLYEKRVVLVWDKRLRIPSNLQGLYRCEFEGEELSWSAGMKLLKAIGKFKVGT